MAVLVPRWLRRNRFAVVVATVAVFMLCTGCAAASNARSTDTYGAAVLEMVPAVLRQSNVTTTAATALMLQNVATMSAAAAKARTHGADILVTPEMAVCGFPFVDHTSVEPYLLELPAPGTALCSHDNPTDAHPSSVLEALGCMAADSNLTVVVGLPERLPCTAHPTFKCPPVGYWQLNTQIAITEQGVLSSVCVMFALCCVVSTRGGASLMTLWWCWVVIDAVSQLPQDPLVRR